MRGIRARMLHMTVINVVTMTAMGGYVVGVFVYTAPLFYRAFRESGKSMAYWQKVHSNRYISHTLRWILVRRAGNSFWELRTFGGVLPISGGLANPHFLHDLTEERHSLRKVKRKGKRISKHVDKIVKAKGIDPDRLARHTTDTLI